MASTFLKYQGNVYEVPEEQVADAVQAGYTAASADDIRMAQASQQPVRAAVEGAARGFTMGLSDVALSKLEQDPKVLEARKVANPWASGVADVAGSVASFLVPVGPGAKLAGAVGKLGLKGVKKLAVEGTLVGLGQTIGQAAREDESLTAEKLAVGAGSGAVASVVLGKAFEGAGKAFNWAGKKLGGKAPMAERLSDLSDDILLREMKPPAAMREEFELVGKYQGDAIKLGRDHGILAKSSDPVSMLEDAQMLAALHRQPMRDAMESLQAQNPLFGTNPSQMLSRANQIAKRVRAAIVGLEPTASAAAIQSKLDKLTLDKEVIKRAVDSVDDLLKQPSTGWQDLWDHQDPLEALGKYGERAANALKQVVYEAGEQASVNIREPVKRAATSLALLSMVKNYASRRAVEMSPASSLFVAGVQGALAGNALGAWGVPGASAAMGAIASVGTKAASGPIGAKMMFGAARGAKALSENKAFTEMADGLAALLKSVPAETLGQFGPVLAAAAARGSQALLETHVELAKSRQGPEYLAAVGLHPETPREMGQAAQRLEHVEVLDQARARYEKVLDDSVAGFFKGGAGGGMPAAVNYEKKMAELTQKLMDPEAVAEKVPSTVYGAAPGVAMASAAHELRVAQFLADKAPKSPWAGAPQAIARPWKPSQSDLRVWAEYVEAAEQPGKVLASLKRGFISEPQREALQTLYPGVYAELQQRLTERLLEWKTPLSYRQRLLASKFLGSAALGMSPQQVMVLQSIHKKAGQASSAAPQGAPDGRQKVDVEQNLQTQAQRLQER